MSPDKVLARLKAMVPDAALCMTMDELLTTIERRLTDRSGSARPLLADMIPGVDTSGMGTYEIMNLIKAMLKDQPTRWIVDRLKAMIPDVTAPGMTLDEIMAAIETRLTAKKALDAYMDQILARLRNMTGADVGNVDDGLVLAETKIEDANQIRAENASLHRIMGRVKAKVNALILDPREKITDLCQALDVVQAEYDRVKERAVERENMISDAIGELRLILGVPKTEDLTLAQIVGVLKAKAGEEREHHTRLCGAVHMLTSTPADRVVNEIVRVVGSRDYYVKALLSRFVNEGVAYNDKTVDEVLSMIEAEQKTLTKRLGTSYAREIELTKEVAEAKTRLEAAGKESADLARALHLAEDKINAQSVHMCQGSAEISVMRADMIDFLREERAQICRELGLARGVSPERVLDQIKGLRDSLLAVVGHPGGESLSLNAALSLLQSKVSGVALSLGLSGYASLVAINTAVENLRKTWHSDVVADSNNRNREHLLKAHQVLFDLNKILRRNLTLPEAISAAVGEISALRAARDNQARTIGTLTANQDAQISAQYLIRTRLLTLLCEDPNRAGTMTTDEVVNLAQSKIAALALNLSLPETATWNGIMSKIQGMTPSLLILAELATALGMSNTVGVNEAMRRATDKIKALRDLLNF